MLAVLLLLICDRHMARDIAAVRTSTKSFAGELEPSERETDPDNFLRMMMTFVSFGGGGEKKKSHRY